MSHSPFLLLVTRTSEPNGYIDRRFRFVYRCGFSQKIVGILNSEEIEYTTFDILGDEGVRQSTFFLSFFSASIRGPLQLMKPFRLNFVCRTERIERMADVPSVDHQR